MSTVDEPAAMFNGAAGVTVKRALELLIEVMLKDAVPVLDTVSGSVEAAPVVTEPKLSDAGETPILGAAAATPVPDKVTGTEACEPSLLAIVNVPVCEPAAAGLNRTVTEVVAPAAIVRGAVGVTVNTALELVRLVTLKLAVPVLAIVSESVPEVPTVTEPKFKAVGDTPILGAAGAVPVPDNGTCKEGCVESLLAMVSVPDCAPADAGLNRTVS